MADEEQQPLPLQLIGRWYPLLLDAGSQQDVQDLATLYTLATTFTLVLCDSIAGWTYDQQEQQQQQQLEGAPLSILRLCFLRQQLGILGQIRRAVRTSQVWHALLLDHLHRVRRDFEVTQGVVAAGRLFSAMLAFFGAVALSTSSSSSKSSSLAIAALASLVLGLCTALVSTIGHSIHLSLPLFRIEDSTRTMRSVAIEAEIGSLAVLHTLITIEQCVESLQIEARFLVDSLCFSLRSSAPEMTTSLEQFGRYAIGWKALADQIGILSGRVRRARRRWGRQGSARRRYHRLRSLLS